MCTNRVSNNKKISVQDATLVPEIEQAACLVQAQDFLLPDLELEWNKQRKERIWSVP
jgi:hypothetical protein